MSEILGDLAAPVIKDVVEDVAPKIADDLGDAADGAAVQPRTIELAPMGADVPAQVEPVPDIPPNTSPAQVQQIIGGSSIGQKIWSTAQKIAGIVNVGGAAYMIYSAIAQATTNAAQQQQSTGQLEPLSQYLADAQANLAKNNVTWTPELAQEITAFALTLGTVDPTK